MKKVTLLKQGSVSVKKQKQKRNRKLLVLPQFLTDQLNLSQPGGADYAHHSTTSPPKFSDLATGLYGMYFLVHLGPDA